MVFKKRYKQTEEHRKNQQISRRKNGWFKDIKKSKRKMSKSHKGKGWEEIHGKEKANKLRKKRSNIMMGKNNPFYEKNHTQKSIDKIIEANLGKKHSKKTIQKRIKSVIEFYDKKGRRSSFNRLLRNSSKWKIWRELVFLRDNFTCQNSNCEFCHNKIGVMLHPHHIKPLALYPRLVFSINNGITYCAEFHLKSKLHKGLILMEVKKCS